MVTAMVTTDQTEDSNPTAVPLRIRVAGPVSAAVLISFTGEPWVPVKYSVSRSITMASRTPTVVARNGRHQPPGTSCR